MAQDMPPPGGFGTINIERTLPKPMVRQAILLAGSIVITLGGFNYAKHWRKRYRIDRTEQMESYIATIPFLQAEQDRKFLIQLYKIREEERELMKDHPNWKVGTLYGEPVYKTLPKDFLPNVSPAEFAPGRTITHWITNVVVPDFWK